MNTDHGKNSRSKEYARQSFLKDLERNPLCYKCKVRPHASNVKMCNKCRNEYQRERRKRDAGGWYKRLTPEQRQKRRARAIIYNNIKRKKMERRPCEVCGNPNGEAHHHLGYDKAHAKDVRFLCKIHHVAADLGKLVVDSPQAPS